jgi:catechol 2,3-dioxygenase-like lactoylglutathione lyase family enzyme
MLTDISIPMLPCRDLEATRRFYSALGFERVTIKFGADRYLILVRRTIELHFFVMPDLAPSSSMHSCYIRVLDADAFYRDFQTRGLPAEGTPSLGAIEDREWGMREFHLLDADSNLLRIGSVIMDHATPETAHSFLLAALRKP